MIYNSGLVSWRRWNKFIITCHNVAFKWLSQNTYYIFPFVLRSQIVFVYNSLWPIQRKMLSRWSRAQIGNFHRQNGEHLPDVDPSRSTHFLASSFARSLRPALHQSKDGNNICLLFFLHHKNCLEDVTKIQRAPRSATNQCSNKINASTVDTYIPLKSARLLWQDVCVVI